MVRERHVISSFSYSTAQIALMDEFAKIAAREDKSSSGLLLELITDYVKKHTKTHNPQTAMDDFKDPGFRARVNLWTIEGRDDLRDLSTEDLREIRDKGQQLDHLARKRLEARGAI